MNSKRLDEIASRVEYFESRRRRATERLASTEGKYWYFAILGIEFNSENFGLDLHPLAKIQSVVEPPGEVELAAALHNKLIFSAVGRYSHQIQYELAVSRERCANDDQVFNLAWWIISALRVRTLSEILIPVVADHSWSTISAITDGSCHVQLIEDVPQARRLSKPTPIQQIDLEWVSLNLAKFADLLKLPKFRLAVESLSNHHFASSERMMAATLWAGIEALFEIQSELRFRLAVVIASILEPRGTSRRELYRVVKKLYDTRSKAVHGSPLTKVKIEAHTLEVRQLLSRILCQFIETGNVPTEDQIGDLIFS